MNSTEIRAASSLAAVYVLRMLGLFMVMPVLAVYAIEYPDYTPLLAGLAIGGYGLTQALLQIPMGMLSDRWGRKPVILAGLSVFALGSFVCAQADSMAWLVVGRLMQGAGAIAGAIMALAGDVSRESQRTKVMAIIGIAIGFSFYLAVILGPVIANLSGLTGIFLLTGVLALLCIPLIFWVVPDADNRAPVGDTLPVADDLLSLLKNTQLMRLNIGVLLLHMLITVLFTQLPIELQQFNLPLDQQWQLYLPVLIISIVGMALLMGYSRRAGGAKVINLSIFIMTAVFAGLAWGANGYIGLFLLVCLFFTAFNYLEANFPAMVSTFAPAGKKGSAMGIYASFQFFGAFLGGAISGLLASWYTPATIYTVVSVTCVLWFLLMQGFRSTERLKRYTLTVNLTNQSVQQLGDKLASLAGVRDITIVPAEQTAYLKVDTREFNLQQAKQSIQAEHFQE